MIIPAFLTYREIYYDLLISIATNKSTILILKIRMILDLL